MGALLKAKPLRLPLRYPVGKSLSSSQGGGGQPQPPAGFQLLQGRDGAYLQGRDGAYLYGKAA